MDEHYKSAAQRLHEFAGESTNDSKSDLRKELEAQGVDVDAFLSRLRNEANIKVAGASDKKPTAADRLRDFANRTGSTVKNLLDNIASSGTEGFPTTAYGRSKQGSRRVRNRKRK